jgi:hypothetical protein
MLWPRLRRKRRKPSDTIRTASSAGSAVAESTRIVSSGIAFESTSCRPATESTVCSQAQNTRATSSGIDTVRSDDERPVANCATR